MALRDSAVGLTCDETPLYPPKTMTLADMPVCVSCSLVFSAPIVGTKTISSRYGNDGLNVEESPLTEITYNNSKYALYDTVLWKSGAHRNFKAKANYDLEMNLYFRDVFNPFKQIAVAIPITIDDTQANAYFTEMADQNPGVRSHSLEKIITTGSVLMYKGIDLRNRNSDKPYAAAQCKDAKSNLVWYVLQPAFISSKDAARIRALAIFSNVLPPAPMHELTLERVRTMGSIISTIDLKSTIDKNNADKLQDAAKNGIYLTRALQCQRINPATDVKKGAVYLNTAPKRSLQDELNEKAADSTSQLQGGVVSGFRPKHIEDILALVIGILLGIVIFSFAAYFITKIFFKGVDFNMSALSGSILPVITAKQIACAPHVTPIILTGPAGTGLTPPPSLPIPTPDCGTASLPMF